MNKTGGHEYGEQMMDEAVEQCEPDLMAAYVSDTDEEKKLVRKIDLYLLPCIWFMYLMSYLDRTNVSRHPFRP